MNKNISIVIVTVILVGMCLIAYNEYANDGVPFASPPPPTSTTAQNTAKQGEVVIPPPTAAQASPIAQEQTPVTQAQAPVVPVQTPVVPAQPLVDPVQSPIVPKAPVDETSPKTEVATPLVVDPALLPPAAEPYKAESASQDAAQKTSPPVTEKTIKRIRVIHSGDGVTVRLDSSEFPAYKAMRLAAPERIVIDLTGTWKLRAPGVPKNPFVANVRIGLHRGGTRIVIDLQKAPGSVRYLKYGEHGLDIRIR